MVDFDVRFAVEEVADLLADSAHEKRLGLITEVLPDVPELVRGDPGRFRQVLVNLAANAVKFTPHGEVVIRVGVEHDSNGTRTVLRVDVRDTGIGIAPAVIGRLFTSFSQGDASTTRTYGGTGLGLAISKQLVDLMGGRIGVQSELGSGSTFWFTVSLEQPAGPPRAAGPRSPSLQGIGMLVVDDNATNRTILEH